MGFPAVIVMVTGAFLLVVMMKLIFSTIAGVLETNSSSTHLLRLWRSIFPCGPPKNSLVSMATGLVRVFAACHHASKRTFAVIAAVTARMISCARMLMRNGTNTPSARSYGANEVGPTPKADVETKAEPIGTCEGKSPFNLANQPTLACRNIEAPHMGMIKILELQRPEAKNAISKQMLQELEEQIDRIHHEASTHQVRSLVIASSINDAFCAGADLKERRRMSIEETQDFLAQLRRTFSKLAALPVPSVASVSGLALGGGLELALCCHFRVFSSNAVVSLPETKLAIIPGAGGTFRLQGVVGLSNALDMILTGRRVGAAEAFRIGLCSRLVEMDENHPVDLERLRSSTLETGVSLAREIGGGGPVAVTAALSALAGGSEEAENAAYDVVLGTQDRAQALEKFGKSRSLAFAGR